MKKPAAKTLPAVIENVEIITGRRGARCNLAGLRNLTISDPPTQEEVMFLHAQLLNLIERLEE